jgi:hypothetical protein
MEVSNLVNIQKAARLLDISTRALHERIKAGYYKVQRVGTILIHPGTNRPLDVASLEAIQIRARGRQPGKYGHYRKAASKSARNR